MAVVVTFKIEKNGTVVFKAEKTNRPRDFVPHWGSGLFDGPEYILVIPPGANATVRDHLSQDYSNGDPIMHQEPDLLLIHGVDCLEKWQQAVSCVKTQ